MGDDSVVQISPCPVGADPATQRKRRVLQQRGKRLDDDVVLPERPKLFSTRYEVLVLGTVVLDDPVVHHGGSCASPHTSCEFDSFNV